MRISGILKDKLATVFGAGGSVGSAVAEEMAAEGAEVFLAGRTRAKVEEVAARIRAAGGRAHAAAVDALDDAAVNDFLGGIVARSGRIDIAFNAVGPPAKDYGNGKHAVDLAIAEFMLPVSTVLRSQFVTARAAARHMVKQGSGVILFLTGSPARGHVEGVTAIGAAFGAIETLTENMALELGRAGVRVVCLRTIANVDSRSIQDTMDALAAKLGATREHVMAGLAGMNFLKVAARVGDTARAAVLLASDQARFMTGTVANFTAGAALD